MSLRYAYKPLTLTKRYSTISISSLISPEQKEYFPHIGNREIVGFGKNGLPGYADNDLNPYPAIRWKAYNDNNINLKVKEQGDWTLLTLEEKKELYRISFRQTFAEFKAFSPHWKLSFSIVFLLMSLSCWVLIFIKKIITTDELPMTFTKEGKWLEMYQRIYMNYGHINGIASQWDYDNLRWKE